jgi:hypothetical protein
MQKHLAKEQNLPHIKVFLRSLLHIVVVVICFCVSPCLYLSAALSLIGELGNETKIYQLTPNRISLHDYIRKYRNTRLNFYFNVT